MKKKSLLKRLWKWYVIASGVYTTVQFIKCRGLKKEDDRHMIGKAIDRLTGYDVEYDSIITIDDTDLHVSYNPYVQLLTNSLGGIAVVITGTTDVYTDARFRDMSADTQKAILAHEMGHYKCNHKPGLTYSFDRIKAILKGQVLPMELEADAYACSVVGSANVVNALKELIPYVHGAARKEVIYRIKAIKERGNE